MKAFYDIKPQKFEAVGNGSTVYRYNIVEVDAPESVEGGEPRKQWQCDEVVIWAPVTKKKVVAAVITATWEPNHEQKLVNEYNSAVLGLNEGEEAAAAREAYSAFLSARRTLKASVEADCDEAGIV